MLTRLRKRKSEGDVPPTKRLSIVLEDILKGRGNALPNSDTDSNAHSKTTESNDMEVTSHQENNTSENDDATSNDSSKSTENQAESAEMGTSHEPNDTSENDGASSYARSNHVEKSATEKTDEDESNEVISLPGEVTEYRMVAGKKIDSKLLQTLPDGYLFKKNKRIASGEMAFTCKEPKCKARVLLDETIGRCKYTDKYVPHNHISPLNEQEIIELQEAMKQRAKNPQLNGGKVETATNIFHSVASTRPDVKMSKSILRTLQKTKSSRIPKAPKTAHEISEMFKIASVREKFGKTMRNDEKDRTDFFKAAFDEDGYSFCVFASDDIIKAIAKIPEQDRKLFADGTFAVCPKPFTQDLVFHADVFGQVVPFAHVLLSNKTQKAYEAVFKYVHNNIMSLNCAVFMTDYELAMRNGLKTIIDESKLSSCWFHFTKACKHNAAKLGAQFKEKIYKDESCRRIYYKLHCVPLLPKQLIMENFEKIETDGRNLKSPLMNKYLNYYRKQWIEREGPEKISVFGLKHRTTSAIEGYNSGIGGKIRKHDNYFNFVTGILEDEQQKAYDVSVLVASGGFSAPKKKSKVKQRDDQINDAVEALKTRTITAEAFLDRLTYHESKVCDSLADFPDEICDDLIIENFETVVEDTPPEKDEITNEPNIDSTICLTCHDRKRDVVLMPCRHQYFCVQCYEQWCATDTGLFEFMDENGNIPSGLGNAPRTVLCPVCKTPISSVVLPIVA